MNKKVEELIRIVLENRGKRSDIPIHSESHLRDDLGMDSLDLAELTVRIEAEYDVDVFADGIVSTVGEIEKKLS
ncbi:acyl carrier protein [Thermaurantimonas aggregans]|uniref:Acyl carrier protein n=1 Tax=Thermaurantimonas aggregans TaxID=2173829 RepID=A0A401XK25_9FLAO|nr:acyl carrier protein [Thermaurantimonas aggregans]GCD77352.1 acyl carrier protein [Thermaurantimonas aggregans]